MGLQLSPVVAGGGSGGGGGGAVDSVFGRTGVVTAESGDYTASEVSFVPNAPFSSTDVQSAIEEAASAKISAVPAVDIDWSLADVFTKTITANTTFTMSQVPNGKTIGVYVDNDGTSTVTWTNPSGLTIEWAGGVVPVQTPNGKDLYIFTRVGSTILGRVQQNFDD